MCQRSHTSLKQQIVASAQSLTQNIDFLLRRVFWTHPSDATCWTMCSQVTNKVQAESPETLTSTTKSWKMLLNEPQIHQAKAGRFRSGRGDRRNRFSRKHSALPFLPVTPLRNRNELIYLCRPQPLLSSSPSAPACTPPLPYLAISALVFCSSWFVPPARAASASFRQALSHTWEGAAGNKGQGYLFARQNSQAAPPPLHSRLIKALQALNDGKYKHYFRSVCEPPLKATEIKSSLWQKIFFWYTCIRKTFIWRWHWISAEVYLLIQVRY